MISEGVALEQVVPRVWRARDTCNVYLVACTGGVLGIDFGSGAWANALRELGDPSVTDVFITHHHRDQLQGLAGRRAAARVWVPESEAHLIGPGLEAHWAGRELLNNYNTRDDRFSAVEPIAIHMLLADYDQVDVGGVTLTVLPTPGHTTGGITLCLELQGLRIGFVGDLIAGEGWLWSLAATEWGYCGAHGVVATIASLVDLRARGFDVLLPAHGEPVADPVAAIDRLVPRLCDLVDLRNDEPPLWAQRAAQKRSETPSPSRTTVLDLIDAPYEEITPHLLLNRSCSANSHVLLSESGNALFFDFGYDLFIWPDPAGWDRAKVRPWLYTLPALKRQFGVTAIEVAIPTHYHDDHVAGLNVLRRVEGTQIWSPDLFADILTHPGDHDLPCLWFDPIEADQVVPATGKLQWREYTLELFPLPGHAHHAVGIAVTVDGARVAVLGDQYGPDIRGRPTVAAYGYKNAFAAGDFRASAELLGRMRPDLVLTGHGPPFWTDPALFAEVDSVGRELELLHHDILDPFGPEARGAHPAARLRPYLSRVPSGAPVPLEVEVENRLGAECEVLVELAIPIGWGVAPRTRVATLPAHGSSRVTFVVTAAGPTRHRARVAADITIDGRRQGQLAEALITVDQAAGGAG